MFKCENREHNIFVKSPIERKKENTFNCLYSLAVLSYLIYIKIKCIVVYFFYHS